MTRSSKATPDCLVGIAPVSWGLDNTAMLAETHTLNWQEDADFSIDLDAELPNDDPPSDELPDDERGIRAQGVIQLGDAPDIGLVVEEPLDELHTLAGSSKEPYTPAEVMLLDQHSAAWRFIVPAGPDRPAEAARCFARLASTFVEAGAAGIFMPGIVALHSPRFIKRVSMRPEQPQNLANLCVHAWHQDDWMMTRGLTAFGMPELETCIDAGMNAAYFRLMDVAAGMLGQGRAYPDGARLTIGPTTFRVIDGQAGPRDERVPFSGTFGVQRVEAAA